MEQRSDGRGFPLSPMLLLIAVGLGWLWTERALEPSAAQVPQFDVGARKGLESIPARMWQDPIRILQTWQASAQDGHALIDTDLERLRESVQAALPNERREGDLLVVPALLPGGALPEDIETRRRARYAIVSGLATRGFVPSDAGHIGAACFGDFSGAHGEEDEHEERAIAFEWYERDRLRPADRTATPRKVLLLWIDESYLAELNQPPLDWLETLLAHLVGETQDYLRLFRTTRRARVVVLGPSSTDALLALMKNAAESPSQRRKRRLSWTLLSYRATAPHALLLNQLEEETSKRFLSLREVFAEAGIEFHQTIPSDDRLIVALIDELGRRGVDLVSEHSKNHVAIISEWDTFYGRALPLTFEALLTSSRNPQAIGEEDVIRQLLRGPIRPPEQVHRFSYLKGVSGTVTAPIRRGEQSETAMNAVVEEAFGDAQLDNINRLALSLSAFEKRMRKLNGGHFAAIGVLGSETGDKQVILQALRRRFPQALFFTTDLDARFTHASQLSWSRNLIVSSGFGFQLSPRLQAQIPPFRDCYQSSAYLATMLAFGPLASGQAESQNPAEARNALVADFSDPPVGQDLIRVEDLPKLLTPRIFELARSGPYDLTPDEYSSALHAKPRPNAPPLLFVIKLGVVALLILLILAGNVRHVRAWVFGPMRPDAQKGVVRYGNFLVKCGIVIGFCALVYWSNHDGAGEPLEVLEGISVWPMEIFRLVALILGWRFLQDAYRATTENRDEMAVAYRLPMPSWTRCDNAGRPEQDREHAETFFTRLSRGCHAAWRVRSQAEQPGDQGILHALARLRSLIARLLLAVYVAWKEISIAEWAESLEAEANTRRLAELPVPTKRKRAAKKKKAAPRAQSKAVSSAPAPVAGAPVAEAWERYVELDSVANRVARITPVLVLFFVLTATVFELFGRPVAPARGAVARNLDVILFYGVLGIGAFLVFWCTDAFRLCKTLIRGLSDSGTAWPQACDGAATTKRRGLSAFEMRELMEIQFAARRTDPVGRLVIYPFAIGFLLILSRNSLFDHWTWPAHYIVIYAVLACHAIGSAWMLRREAERARERAIRRLRARLVVAQGGDPSETANEGQIRTMIADVQAMRRGAFSPPLASPVVQALGMPLGGAGLVTLLEFMSVSG